ncbi:MAG: AAA family ATPase, partial [Thermoanaerobaculia bacterium]
MAPSPLDAGRRQYLDFHARCHQAFTPFAPIQLPDFFAGRLDVLRRIQNELAAPGRHVAIFGERGVGKTSLAELLSFFTPFEPESSHVVRCARESTFESIFAEFLEHFGSGLSLDSVERDRGANGRLRAGPVGAGAEARQRRTYRNLPQAHSVSRSRLLRGLAREGRLLIIDEYDRVQDSQTHTRMAELIKAFSDAASSSKLVIVGVADSIRGLIGEHTSLSRSLAQIKLDRMSREELADIITRGEERTAVRFRPQITERIVALADGFPHYVHLVALYSA